MDDTKYPVEFWSHIVKILDERIKNISEGYGWGEVDLKIVIREKKILDVGFSDQITIRRKDILNK